MRKILLFTAFLFAGITFFACYTMENNHTEVPSKTVLHKKGNFYD